MKKNYLEPQVILCKLLDGECIRTSIEVVEDDNCGSWLDAWSGAGKGGNAE